MDNHKKDKAMNRLLGDVLRYPEIPTISVENLEFMPMSCFVRMPEKKSVKTHLINLFETYGKDKVLDHIIELLEELK